MLSASKHNASVRRQADVGADPSGLRRPEEDRGMPEAEGQPQRPPGGLQPILHTHPPRLWVGTPELLARAAVAAALWPVQSSHKKVYEKEWVDIISVFVLVRLTLFISLIQPRWLYL